MTVDLLCMGEPMLEFNQLPPNPDGTQHYLQGHGGDTSNAAIAAARQGASVGYITALGQDMPGDSFISLWQRENVDTSTVLRTDRYQTGVYFVTHDARRPSLPALPRELRRRDVRALRRAGGRDQGRPHPVRVRASARASRPRACDAVFKAIDVAARNGVAVAYDTNYRPAAVATGARRRGDARGHGARRLRHAGAGGRVDPDRPDRPGQDAGFLLAPGLQGRAAEDGRGGVLPRPPPTPGC